MTRTTRRLVVAAALAPVALFVATRLGERMWLLSDSAAIDLGARDIWHGDLPLVGVYSRFGFHHPGPFLFYWLAPFVAISRGHAWGATVGGGVLQGLAIVTVGRITARERDVRWLLAGVTSVLFTLVALGNDGITIPWNPHIAASWFVVVVWTTWAIWNGRVSLAGWWLVAASITVQTHVGYAPVVGVCGLWVVSRLGLARRARTFERPSVVSLVLGALLWLPVVADQIGGSGNLHSLARFAINGHGTTVGLRRAAGMVASAFRVVPDWMSGALRVDPFTSETSRSSIALLLIALLVAGALSWKSRDPRVRSLLVLATSLVATGVIAVAQIRDGAYAYLMSYVPAAAIILVTGGLLAASARVQLRAVVAVVLTAGLLWSSGVLVHEVVARDGLNDRANPDFESLLVQLPSHPGRVLLRSTGGFATMYFGLVDELDRRGIDARVDPIDADKFGDKRVGVESEVDQLWYVSESAADTDLVLARLGGSVLASTTPLSSSRELELSALRQRIAGQLRAAGRDDLLTALSSSLVPVLLRDVPGVDLGLLADLADRNREVERSTRCQCAVISVPVRR